MRRRRGVKILIGDTPEQNYNGLNAGGYWTATYPSLSRGDQIQVQANIRGIDAKRTDVVTVTASTARRPDIAVVSVTGPEESAPHGAVTFTATVSEINGDVGARSNCVLSIDGADVDQANGIWVDAGGTVSCMFTHVFDAPGTYSVAIAAVGVNPADWDAANNSAARSITVTQPGQPIQRGYMQAGEQRSFVSYRAWNTGVLPFDYRQQDRSDFAHAYLSGSDLGIAAGGMQQVNATVSVDGSVMRTASLTPVWWWDYDDGNYYVHCGGYNTSSWDGTTYRQSADYAEMCSYGARSDPGSQQAYYAYVFVAGDVTYYGSTYYCEYYGSCSTYTYNYNAVYGSGVAPGWAAGTAVGIQVSFVDANGVAHTADRSVTLVDRSEWLYNGVYSFCYPDDYRDGSNTCVDYSRTGTFFFGQTSW
ncbi:MAG: hypothetical protein ACR2G6_06385 [Gemmatimonadaceae bacterium]